MALGADLFVSVAGINSYNDRYSTGYDEYFGFYVSGLIGQLLSLLSLVSVI